MTSPLWGAGIEPQATAAGRGTLLVLAGGAVALAALPALVSPYHLIVVAYGLVLAIACLGVNLLLGHTGLLSFGHAAYFGVGAYAGGFIYSFAELTSLEMYLLPGVGAAASLAAVIGLPCVRSTRIHFTILTLAFAQAIHSLFISGAVFRLAGGQGQGLFLLGGGGLYIPRFTIAGAAFDPEQFQVALYFVILTVFVVSALVMWWIVNTPFGKALHAIRDNDTRAECIGIRTRRYRWGAFVISGTFAGLAGGLFGQLDRQVTPDQLHWLFSAKLVLATVLGGHRHLLGPVIGALAFAGLQEFALGFTQYYGAVLGVLLVTVVLTFPGGLTGCAIAAARRVGVLRRAPEGP
jgi:branched-chain amino acid transport system permease protein